MVPSPGQTTASLGRKESPHQPGNDLSSSLAAGSGMGGAERLSPTTSDSPAFHQAGPGTGEILEAAFLTGLCGGSCGASEAQVPQAPSRARYKVPHPQTPGQGCQPWPRRTGCSSPPLGGNYVVAQRRLPS